VTSTSAHSPSHASDVDPAAAAIAIARFVNGNARPSLRPASEVSANRTGSSCSSGRISSANPSVGGVACTSDASTGSVGATTAPSRTAVAPSMPRVTFPTAAVATMVSGITTASRRHVEAHARRSNGRSIFSPAPISATMTNSSVMRSATSGFARGSGGAGPTGSPKRTTPEAT
jgi:hypothetical protein